MIGFSDVIGQEENAAHLKRVLSAGRVHHAWIFCGEEGSGRRRLAEAFAAALLCEQGGEEACGVCPSCRQFAADMHPDFRRVIHEKEGLISAAEIREQLVFDAENKPRGHRKVYLVDDAQLMNETAQNALLKTIEEPPPYAVMILIAPQPESLLPTIRSRCLSLKLVPVDDEQVVQWLMENQALPDYRARTLAAFARGSIGRASALAASEVFSDRVALVAKLMEGLSGGAFEQRLEREAEAAKDPEGLAPTLDLMELWLRDVLMIKAVGERARVCFLDNRPVLVDQARTMGFRDIRLRQEALERARRELRFNVQPAQVLSVLLNALEL